MILKDVFKIDRRFPYFIKDWISNLKELWQIITKGYSYKEVWSLFYHISKKYVGALKKIKEAGSYPCSVTEEEWQLIMEKIIYAFEILAKDEPCSKETINNADKIQEGCELFGEWFRDLWV